MALEPGVALDIAPVSLASLHSLFTQILAGHHIEGDSVTDWTSWKEKGNLNGQHREWTLSEQLLCFF